MAAMPEVFKKHFERRDDSPPVEDIVEEIIERHLKEEFLTQDLNTKSAAIDAVRVQFQSNSNRLRDLNRWASAVGEPLLFEHDQTLYLISPRTGWDRPVVSKVRLIKKSARLVTPKRKKRG